MIVNIDIGLTVVAGNDNARFLLFGEVQTRNHLENFNENIDFKGQDFKELMEGILEFFIKKVVSSVQFKTLSPNDPVKNGFVEFLHAWRASHIGSISEIYVLVILENNALLL